MSSRRARGNARGGSRRQATAYSQMPFGILKRESVQLMDMAREEQLDLIHSKSLELLRDYGAEFMSLEAQDLLEEAGCKVDRSNGRVRFEPAFVEEMIARAPATFQMKARDPEKSFTVGGPYMAVALVSSTPNSMDLDRGRRPGNKADFEELLKIGQMTNAANYIGGYVVEPIDIAPNIRHLDGVQSILTLTDKMTRLSSIGKIRTNDTMEMIRIANGVDDETFHKDAYTYTVLNVNSPMRVDEPLMEGAIEMAKRGQPTAITPFTLCGAMAPVTVAGALVQHNAEFLCVAALLQYVAPGSPLLYGSFTSNVDMKSGAPAFGTPENVKAQIVAGQMARRYALPLRASNVSTSNAPDAQAAYESEMSLWACLLNGAHMIQHGLGWMEGGLTVSYEKVILDAEMVQMMRRLATPVDFDDLDLAIEAIKDVGPGGHFFGTQHTLDRYETAFYDPLVSDWRNYEQWEGAGSPDAAQRANAIWKNMLENYQQPAMDPAIREALDAFCAKRREEIGSNEI